MKTLTCKTQNSPSFLTTLSRKYDHLHNITWHYSLLEWPTLYLQVSTLDLKTSFINKTVLHIHKAYFRLLFLVVYYIEMFPAFLLTIIHCFPLNNILLGIVPWSFYNSHYSTTGESTQLLVGSTSSSFCSKAHSNKKYSWERLFYCRSFFFPNCSCLWPRYVLARCPEMCRKL